VNGIKLIERGSGSDLLKARCRELKLPVELVRRLVDIELRHVGRGKRHGIYAEFDEVFTQLTSGSDDVP
jgi:hypothetical protein